MDPNATLRSIRLLAAAILADDELDQDPDAVDLAELVTGLDEWVATGGFLPDAWRQEARFLA